MQFENWFQEIYKIISFGLIGSKYNIVSKYTMKSINHERNMCKRGNCTHWGWLIDIERVLSIRNKVHWAFLNLFG